MGTNFKMTWSKWTSTWNSQGMYVHAYMPGLTTGKASASQTVSRVYPFDNGTQMLCAQRTPGAGGAFGADDFLAKQGFPQWSFAEAQTGCAARGYNVQTANPQMHARQDTSGSWFLK